MASDRVCERCGCPLPASRGRAAKQCGECERGRRRVKIRSASCVDCRATFVPPGQTGMLPKRCAPCADEHARRAGTARQRQWRAANPERERAAQQRYNAKRLADPEHRRRKRENEVLRNYGLSPEGYDALLATQNGVCAVCGNGHSGPGKRLHVDHCHNSSRVRGLLCAPCNTAIGLLKDDPVRAERLAEYLRR